VKRITSRQNSVVARFRDVRDGQVPGLLLLDGLHLVAGALEAGYHLIQIVVLSDRADDPDIAPLLARAEAAKADVALASAPVMAAVSPVRSASPVVAIAHRPAADSQMFDTPRPLVVIACDVQDPGNIGAMTRVAEAAGASGVVTTGRSADPFGWKALRGSMGSALRLPVAACATPEDAVSQARRHGCLILATVPQGGTSIFDTNLTGPLAILVGGEGSGLSSDLVAASDRRASIPMRAPVESLNAAVAAALIVYEARRQRG
jgi:RNA methyltransferase, TrmH family